MRSWLFDKTKVDCTTCVFFYGQKGATACLSNWYPAAFKAPAHLCVTEETPDRPIRAFWNTEQYMMYMKALRFKDYDTAANILLVPKGNPRSCKDLGRSVKGFVQDDWDSVAIDIVTEGVFHKFDQNDTIRKILLETGSLPIAEASNDLIWGIGLKATVASTTPASEWPGTNYLGECLMRARTRLTTKGNRPVCVVCLGASENLFRFPCCNQEYHSNCMKTMLAYNHHDCPACRTRIPCGLQCVFDNMVPYTYAEYTQDVQKTKFELQEYGIGHSVDSVSRVSRIRNEHLLLNWKTKYTHTDYVGKTVCNSRSWFRLTCTLDLIATHFASAEGIEFIEHDNDVRRSVLPFPPICQDWAHLSTEYHGFKHKMVEVFDTLIDRILNGTNGFPQQMLSGCEMALCVAEEIALAMAERHIFHHKDNVWPALPPTFHQFYLSLPQETDTGLFQLSEVLRQDMDADDLYNNWKVIFNESHCEKFRRSPMKLPHEWFDRFY